MRRVSWSPGKYKLNDFKKHWKRGLRKLQGREEDSSSEYSHSPHQIPCSFPEWEQKKELKINFCPTASGYFPSAVSYGWQFRSVGWHCHQCLMTQPNCPPRPSCPCLPAEDKGIVASHAPESLIRLELPLAESERHQDAATTSSLQRKSFQGLQVENGASWHTMNCWRMILNTHTSTHSLDGGGSSPNWMGSRSISRMAVSVAVSPWQSPKCGQGDPSPGKEGL